jgi:hypothetical protein
MPAYHDGPDRYNLKPPIIDQEIVTARKLWRDKVVLEINAEFNMPPHDHRRWRDLRDNMAIYPVRVRWHSFILRDLTTS